MLSIVVSVFLAAAPVQDTAQVSQQDAAQLRDQAKSLATALGVQTEPPKPQQPPQPAPTTMPQVADKALGMLGNLVAGVSQTLNKVAPEVWRVMIRQQYAKAIGNFLTPFLFFLTVVIYMLVMKGLWKCPARDDDQDEWIAWMIFCRWIPMVFGIIFFMVFAYDLVDSIQILINPEFYALKDLLTMVFNPSSLTH